MKRTLQIKVDIDSSSHENKKIKNIRATHKEFSGIASSERATNVSGVQIVRNTPKIGRNDPCSCGSEKKYKNCHGRK